MPEKVTRKSLSVTCAHIKGTEIKWQDTHIVPQNVQFMEI